MKIQFEDDFTANAAFQDGQRESEISRILHKIADDVENGKTYGVMHDINGNRVGEWEM